MLSSDSGRRLPACRFRQEPVRADARTAMRMGLPPPRFQISDSHFAGTRLRSESPFQVTVCAVSSLLKAYSPAVMLFTTLLSERDRGWRGNSKATFRHPPSL